MNRFDAAYLRIKRALINEASDEFRRENANPSMIKNQELYFHFYDAFGDVKYIIPWRPTSPSKYVPNAPERITNAAMSKSNVSPMDRRNRGYMENSIENSLRDFDTFATQSKENGFVSRDKSFPDKNFTYSYWTLIRNTDGFCFAAGRAGSSPNDWHIGENTGYVMTGAGRVLNDRRKANEKGDTQSASTYELRCYKDGVETYAVPFTPRASYGFEYAKSKWDLVGSTSRKDFKDKKKDYVSPLKAWLNNAIQDTLDYMIEQSDKAPASTSSSYPRTSIDSDFEIGQYKIFKNGELLCWGDYNDMTQKYVKFTNPEF